MTEIHTSKRRSPIGYFILAFVIFMVGGMFFLFKGCSSESSPIISDMVLEKGGKKFLYAEIGPDAVKVAIEQGNSPQLFKTLLVYQDGDEYFVGPSTITKLAAIASGEYTVHTYKEASVDGYVTVGNVQNYTSDVKFKTSAKIGEQDMINTVTVKNSKGAEMTIRWTMNSKTGEYSQLKNCEMHAFWVQSNPAPGQTVISSADYLVVPLETLATFFKRKMTFDRETGVLTISE